MVSAFSSDSSYNNGNWGSRIDKAHAQGSRGLFRSAQGPWEKKGLFTRVFCNPPYLHHACLLGGCTVPGCCVS